MAVTLYELRARCRLILSDATGWPDATLDGWIGDAIRAYSLEFPRVLRSTLDLVTGTQVYELLADIIAVTGVEYPAGETPAEYLELADEWSALFRAGGCVYALQGKPPDRAPSDDYVNWQIAFAPTVADGEQAIVTYKGLHQIPVVGADDDYTSVPDSHLEAIEAFVEYRSWVDLQTRAGYAAETTEVWLNQLSDSVRRAWNRYKEVTGRLHELMSACSGRVVWGNIGL